MHRPTLVTDNTARPETNTTKALAALDQAKTLGKVVTMELLSEIVALETKLLDVQAVETIPIGIRESFRDTANIMRARHDGILKIQVRA